MQLAHVSTMRRVAGVASVLVAALTIAATLSAPAGAQPAPAQSDCGPVLELGNPNPGDLLLTGDTIFSGTAFDPAASSGAGVSRVDLFLGARESGGSFLGSAIPGNGMSNVHAWQVKVTVPQNISGGRDFVAYATSSVTGQTTTVSVPVFVGASPTPTPTGTQLTPVALTETTTSTCPPATTTSTTATAPVQVVRPAVAAETAPVLSLANPSSGALLSTGDLIVQGLAYDPAATTGSGIDSVSVFLDSRDSGGIEIGSGVPGVGSNAHAFQITASIPSNVNGGHNFVVYARSSITGQETVTSVPVYIGTAPTPTPRPRDTA